MAEIQQLSTRKHNPGFCNIGCGMDCKSQLLPSIANNWSQLNLYLDCDQDECLMDMEDSWHLVFFKKKNIPVHSWKGWVRSDNIHQLGTKMTESSKLQPKISLSYLCPYESGNKTQFCLEKAHQWNIIPQIKPIQHMSLLNQALIKANRLEHSPNLYCRVKKPLKTWNTKIQQY